MKKYLRHKTENIVDIKELLALEYLDLKGKYKNYTEFHEFWELCYVESGELLLKTDSEELSLSGGEMTLIPPSKLHSYREKSGKDVKAFVVCFESQSVALKAMASGIFKVSEAQKNCLNIIIEESEGTFKTNEKDQLEISENPNLGGQQAIINQLEYLFILNLRLLSKGENSDIIFLGGEDFYAGLASVILRLFRENIRNKITLDDICRKVNYSRSFICRTFKAQTGESLISCFNRMKIEEAERMLLETRLSASRISGELGFSDAKYFNTLFKKQTGLSPVAYRKAKGGRQE